MKGKELFNVLLLCCCLLILSGSFLPYISVNFPDTNAGWGARSVIQEQLPEMFRNRDQVILCTTDNPVRHSCPA